MLAYYASMKQQLVTVFLILADLLAVAGIAKGISLFRFAWREWRRLGRPLR
jgi:hypothetical protein